VYYASFMEATREIPVYTDLHDFAGASDGAFPFGSVTLDANSNLYGTASSGGANDWGVVWKITP
jgi:uncharacterized repeat protein (TIGR03803 family)